MTAKGRPRPAPTRWPSVEFRRHAQAVDRSRAAGAARHPAAPREPPRVPLPRFLRRNRPDGIDDGRVLDEDVHRDTAEGLLGSGADRRSIACRTRRERSDVRWRDRGDGDGGEHGRGGRSRRERAAAHRACAGAPCPAATRGPARHDGADPTDHHHFACAPAQGRPGTDHGGVPGLNAINPARSPARTRPPPSSRGSCRGPGSPGDRRFPTGA